MLQYIRYFRRAIQFISIAAEAGVLEAIMKARQDRKLSVNELLDIATKLSKAAGVDLDTTGIKL